MAQKKDNVQLRPEDVVLAELLSIPCGALAGGIIGSVGRVAVSFFNPVVASVAGNFALFAGVGAIAAPIVLIPKLIADLFFENSLPNHPNLKSFLQNTSTFLLSLAAVTAAAAILSTSFVPTIFCMMIIPTVIYAISALCNFINACFFSNKASDEASTHSVAVLAP